MLWFDASICHIHPLLPLPSALNNDPRKNHPPPKSGAAEAQRNATRRSVHVAEELVLEDVLALLVLLALLIGLVVLPADRLVALLAGDVAHDVAARRHVALRGLAGFDVDHDVKEVRLAVLAAKVLFGGDDSWRGG